MNIPINSPVGYIGVFFLIAGTFLILAGMNILKVQQISVVPGKKTWAIGIIVAIVGGIALITDVTKVSNSDVTNKTSATAQSTLSLIEASGDVILEEANTWPVVVEDSFENDKEIWSLGIFENSDEKGELSLTNDGKLKWDMTALSTGPYHTLIPAVDPVSNFYLSADVKLIQGDKDHTRYGLIFRANGDKFYSYRIEDGPKYRVRYLQDKWINLTGQMSTSLNTKSSNKLSVIALNDRLIFFINDRLVEDLRDTNSTRGNVGLIVTVDSLSGANATLEFDNFILRKSP